MDRYMIDAKTLELVMGKEMKGLAAALVKVAHSQYDYTEQLLEDLRSEDEDSEDEDSVVMHYHKRFLIAGIHKGLSTIEEVIKRYAVTVDGRTHVPSVVWSRLSEMVEKKIQN